MNDIAQGKAEPFLSKRRLWSAGIAAFIGCAACCALPLIAAAGLGGGAATTIASLLKPGSELLVGGVVFAVVLGVMALRHRAKREQGCGPMCRADGTCCNRGARVPST